ncbi:MULTISPECIES: type VI secretion system baseplate subunit TssF [Bordetella]|uniref:Type VI secretion system baseplate subunit TssF n=2 Tax=Bordetella TaxID=517 RepID=K0MEC6_BORPB|nr:MULTISPECIES: type VI secretion system baseplate subunit TssF [Bordetella]KAK66678.1 type VI secretion protein, TIGR03359 family [Bordetella bronchiseptica 980-2]KDD49992.1 type VI secretion protein, TIGR03359 family [Bordetella bronchiseptica OSU553]AMG87315.1 type VI secretion system baseplate subunit TssF [Bordetella bronchiseptica]AWP82369.1 type VI secretion system protein ImpG [Bordetella bronchiseptica]KAB1446640.1 type VI secretion system baseplate subunit TssF [Bordetella bronchise
MDARLLDYYNRELVYMRELGAEFARQHPKVAGRLGMHGTEVADPYVERLLEGFSFLAARIHLKMDAEFPRFTQRLLEVVHPHYLAPTPAMAVAQFSPSMNEGTLAGGFTLPRGTVLRGGLARGEQTPCEFMTGHALRLWPLRVTAAELTGAPTDLPLARLGLGGREAGVASALRLRLEVCGGVSLEELDLDQLVFYLNGPDAPMQRLLELIMCHTVAVLGHDSERPVSWINRLPADAVRHEGFADDQALLPTDTRVFQGYRLLQEYFAFARRYLFFSLNGLKQGLCTRRAAPAAAAGPAGTRRFDLTLLLSAAAPELEGAISAGNLALHCAPIVNLFPRRADRVAVTPRHHEYHVVVDRTRPLDFEVYSLTRVLGHMSAQRPEQEFRPFYGSFGADADDYGAYYSLRREPRLASDSARRHGTRTSYTGSEVYLSLVDRHEAPFADTLRHLGIDALCTNRDLALLLPLGGASDFSLRVSAPVGAIKVLHGPSRPAAAMADHGTAWQLISHLGLHYHSLTDLDETRGAQTLRELLNLYGNLADPVARKHISGVRHVRVEPMHHRLPVPGPIVYGRGVRIDLQVDETAFSGISPYLFGAVLEQFFARHVSINMMSALTLSTPQRGAVASWRPRMGRRPAV